MHTMITDPALIYKYSVLATIKGLEIELKTGMRHSSNMTFNNAKRITKKKTRKSCLQALHDLYATL